MREEVGRVMDQLTLWRGSLLEGQYCRDEFVYLLGVMVQEQCDARELVQ